MTTAAKRILHIDDEPAAVHAVARALHRRGYEITGGNGAQDAMEWLASETFHAVLLDVMMPKANGLKVLRGIRQHHPSLPVIMLTGADFDFVRADAMAAGCDGFLQKAYCTSELVEQIEVAARKRSIMDFEREGVQYD